ncbi:UNVERIFIED_CONTAM: hypothetical protein K2H54_038330 [Gekko kuhli]
MWRNDDCLVAVLFELIQDGLHTQPMASIRGYHQELPTRGVHNGLKTKTEIKAHRNLLSHNPEDHYLQALAVEELD